MANQRQSKNQSDPSGAKSRGGEGIFSRSVPPAASPASVRDLIIGKFENAREGWGEILNRIQAAAETALPRKNFETYLDKARIDVASSEGGDGLLLNGEYFDWREFDSKRIQIVRAYLRYFSSGELRLINALL